MNVDFPMVWRNKRGYLEVVFRDRTEHFEKQDTYTGDSRLPEPPEVIINFETKQYYENNGFKLLRSKGDEYKELPAVYYFPREYIEIVYKNRVESYKRKNTVDILSQLDSLEDVINYYRGNGFRKVAP